MNYRKTKVNVWTDVGNDDTNILTHRSVILNSDYKWPSLWRAWPVVVLDNLAHRNALCHSGRSVYLHSYASRRMWKEMAMTYFKVRFGIAWREYGKPWKIYIYVSESTCQHSSLEYELWMLTHRLPQRLLQILGKTGRNCLVHCDYNF